MLSKNQSEKRHVIFVADDFGMNAEINEAILHAHVSGVLRGAALMMAQPATNEAVAMARDHPALETGWHVHLNDSIPSTIDHWPWKASPVRAGLSITLSRRARELMRREIRQQWELFRGTGLTCHFVNSHHHLHAHPAIFETLRDVLGADFQGWIRLGKIRRFGAASRFLSSTKAIDALFGRERRLSSWRCSDTLWGLDRLCDMRAHEVDAAISTLPEGFHEFLFHPRNLFCPDTQCLLELKSLLTD